MHCFPFQCPLSTGRCLLRPDHQQRAHFPSRGCVASVRQVGLLAIQKPHQPVSEGWQAALGAKVARFGFMLGQRTSAHTLRSSKDANGEMIFLTTSWSLPRCTANQAEHSNRRRADVSRTGT